MSRSHAAAVALTLAATTACSSNLFTDYPEVAGPGVAAFQQGRFEAAAEQFRNIEKADKDDAFLAWAEIGMAHHVHGNLAAATKAWLKADRARANFDGRPTISGRTITEGFVSALVNEKALPYDGEDFEVALLHGMLAWDFLRQGDLNGAMVEVARGYRVEKKAEDRYGNAYGMNRFARFVAAVAQEVDLAFDEAEIDLKLLEEEGPGNPAVQYSLERVRRLQGEAGSEERAVAQIIVVHEAGRMPHKMATEIQYDTRHSIGRVSLPAFRAPDITRTGLEVWVAEASVGQTSALEDVFTTAKQNLEDRLTWIIAKGIGRAAAKTIVIDRVVREVEKEHGKGWGLAASVLGSLLQISTERADLRSWSTLPQRIEVLRAPVEPGKHSLSVQLPDSGKVALGIHSFQPGQPVLVTVRSLGGRVYAQASAFAIAAPEPGAPATSKNL
ncbi:MAG: hypothetical protein MK209_05520 [Planctomycetes bacterium]|nr:hypothetical protein [Planctomycetota bacterium]